MVLTVSLAAVAGVAACGGSSTPSAGTKSSATSSPRTSASGPSAKPSSAAPSSSSSTAPANTVSAVPIETNPPGDIPDNLAFVKYTNRQGHYAFTHPEGWAQTTRGVQVNFTDKLNGVTVDSLPGLKAPTVNSVRSTEIPRLQAAVPAFELRSVSAVTLPAGKGVHIVFRRNSDPNAVTGKVYRDEVEEYFVYQSGRLVRMDLYGPVGADNVDAYNAMAQSLTIQ
jgi:hypothetical protein